MLDVRLALWFESDDLLVNHVELKDGRLHVAERSVSTLPIRHVVVHHHEFISQCPEDVEYSPLFLVDLIQVYLSWDLVNIIQHIDREIFEHTVFASLTVKLEVNMLILKSIRFDDVLECIKSFCWPYITYLRYRSEANAVKLVEPLICLTRCLLWICAVILNVWIAPLSTH